MTSICSFVCNEKNLSGRVWLWICFPFWYFWDLLCSLERHYSFRSLNILLLFCQFSFNYEVWFFIWYMPPLFCWSKKVNMLHIKTFETVYLFSRIREHFVLWRFHHCNRVVPSVNELGKMHYIYITINAYLVHAIYFSCTF